MNSDQLRELADALECRIRDAATGEPLNDDALVELYHYEARPLIDYLRAQADAQPVAWRFKVRVWLGEDAFEEQLRVSTTFREGAEPLYAAPAPQPAIPEGWKLVPVEPTPEMVKAGGHANSEWLNDSAPLGESRYAMPMQSVWKDMLAAAPAPTAQREPTNAQREPLSDEQIEAAYWEFDARKKGYGQWKGCPMTDRDAFKWALRAALAAKE